MSNLDYLRGDNNKPKEGVEYLFVSSIVWPIDWDIGEPYSYPIKKGSVVTDIVKQDDRSLHFTIKETGERRKCNYGWAFIEGTPENKKRYEEFLAMEEELKEFASKVQVLRDRVVDLGEDRAIVRVL